MWFVWLVLGIIGLVLWTMYGSRGLCPSCGTELDEDFSYPGQAVNYCTRCGWRRT
jgi:hypothetical protein